MDSKLTPMMKQYMEIKRKHPSEILFFRMGDFYEMFFEDAQAASKILDIALTSRQNDVPMCGIPYHAAESYIARLIKAGKRVAICEQLESVPSSGNVVRRDVVRIITPGTVIEQNLLADDDNNYLGSLIIGRDRIGMAFVDISTGDFYLSSIEKSLELFRGELTRFNPREVVLHEGDEPDDRTYADQVRNRDIPIYRINEWLYDADYMRGLICETFGVNGLSGLGLDSDVDVITCGSILQYLRETHKKDLTHLRHPRRILDRDRMILDDATITHLELVTNSFDRTKNRTLFSVLNRTRTAMGRRALERNILQPLLDEQAIERRLDFVQYFFEYHDLARQVQEIMKDIHDLERIVSRFTIGRIFPRNFVALANSAGAAGQLRALLADQPHEGIADLASRMPSLAAIEERVRLTIDDDPAISPEQGRVIRPGFDPELDRLYGLKTNAKNWILEYQEEEKKRLGLSTLKIRYNRILGYYIEVSKAQSESVPADYFRKQTLVGAERYTSKKLQEFESEILTASDKITALEETEIEKLRLEVVSLQKEIQLCGELIGETDYYCSLAVTAAENRYVRPCFNREGIVRIEEGRHPVVEKYFTREIFIPNDIYLDGKDNIIKIITGPNMSGKSTYIRMAAVLQLMAQIGSFVPAASCDVTLIDRIFTRIGASDNITRGESTFLVEMNETANILNNATERSLIIMDEVGRGTSTYDGLSIAWAIVEYILRYVKSRTLFATHYHELTQLGGKNGAVNYNVLVQEHIAGVEFLHKVVRGSADKSYGIHVARLAGIPKPIIGRAEKILERLEKSRRGAPAPGDPGEESSTQLEIFNAANHRLVQALEAIDPDRITPLEAINELHRLKKIIS